LALRLDQVQASQRARLSQAQLTQAQYQAIVDISSSYTQLLEAQAQRDLAALARDLSAQSLEIAKIRLSKGSATTLDVQEAENSLEDANKNLQVAEQGVALSQSSLASLIAQPAENLEPISEAIFTAAPELETVLQSVANTPTLIQVTNGAELASVAVDLLDPSYASQSQIDNANLQASQAAESVKEARRALELQAQNLFNQVGTSAQSYQIQLDALNNALERESLEKQRLDAGLIAEIQFKQTQLATQQARIAAMQAKHSYLKALLNLQAGTLTPLEGLNGY
jgi:outer membrane protein TolC